MEYLIPLMLVILLVAGFLIFMVFNATKKSGSAADRRAGEGEGAPGIGADDTPLGDTAEHAGEQTTEGTTIGGQDAQESGGTGRPVHSGSAGTSGAGESASVDPDAAAHIARPGEGEGAQALEFDGHQPPPVPGSAPGATAAGTPDTASAPAAEAVSPERAEQAEDTRPASERLADRGA